MKCSNILELVNDIHLQKSVMRRTMGHSEGKAYDDPVTKVGFYCRTWRDAVDD